MPHDYTPASTAALPPLQDGTLGALLSSATACLHAAGLHYGHGTTCAEDEARWLVLWQLGLPLDTDEADPAVQAQPITAEQCEAVAALLARRVHERKPAAYLTGEAWLMGLPFFVDERSIVPRSFIAELIADADGSGLLDSWLGADTHQVLDLCTGNGSLACLAALAWPEVQVTGADISADALAVARRNVQRHGLQERVTLVQSDGLAATPGPWDLVLCNPPYVNTTSMAALPAEYRHEPALALDGGSDGMDFIRQLLVHAPACMSAGAVLVLEIGNERAHFEAAFPYLPVVWLPVSAGNDQVLLITRRALTDMAAAA